VDKKQIKIETILNKKKTDLETRKVNITEAKKNKGLYEQFSTKCLLKNVNQSVKKTQKYFGPIEIIHCYFKRNN
jgi:hypothetical protein